MAAITLLIMASALMLLRLTTASYLLFSWRVKELVGVREAIATGRELSRRRNLTAPMGFSNTATVLMIDDIIVSQHVDTLPS